MGCWYRPNIILGTSGDDVITGTDGRDIVFAGSGDDVIQTGDGNDKIFADRGDDEIDAGSGNDLVFAGSGDDTVNAGSGNDLVFGGSGDDSIDGGAGCDGLFGQSGNDTILGGTGNDLIYGGHGNDDMDGGDGCDLVIGGRGDDIGQGGAGSDLVFLGSGNDTGVYDISLNTGSWDVYKGGSGIDTLVIKTSFDELDMLGITEADIINRFNAYAPGWVTFADLGFDLMAKQFENIMLMGGPKAVDDMANVSEDGPALTIDVLTNDMDIGGGALSIVSVDDSGVTGGGMVSFTAGDVSFDPAGAYESLGVGASAMETFTYTVEDLDGNQATATVMVTIDGVNDDPMAMDDTESLLENVDTGATGNLLSNDSDVDIGDVLNVTIINNESDGSVDGTYGTLDWAADGSYTYTLDESKLDGPAEGIVQDIFTYSVSDGNGGSDTASLTIDIETADDEIILSCVDANDTGGPTMDVDISLIRTVAYMERDGVAGYNHGTDQAYFMVVDDGSGVGGVGTGNLTYIEFGDLVETPGSKAIAGLYVDMDALGDPVVPTGSPDAEFVFSLHDTPVCAEVLSETALINPPGLIVFFEHVIDAPGTPTIVTLDWPATGSRIVAWDSDGGPGSGLNDRFGGLGMSPDTYTVEGVESNATPETPIDNTFLEIDVYL